AIGKERKMLEDVVLTVEEVSNGIDDNRMLLEMAAEEDDADAFAAVESDILALEKRIADLEFKRMFNQPADANNCFIDITAGAGGTEAEDWALMLSRMYTRWVERQGFKLEIVDQEEAEGGIKSITIQVEGDYAYGYLKGEAGVHRLVRISPFDSNARRHTSFASVFVYPIIDDTIEVNIKPEDLRVDTYRAGGKGGQHVNKTESAVRFTHIPTGIVVACQSERSQLMNRASCMSILRSKLYEYYREQKEKENSKYGAEKKEISWGNQIRSYVFQPYTMVKDHRTKCETGNIQAVMDGELDPFMNAFLIAKWKGVPMESADETEDM
ncbi:MAG: peptide chain release factor 2, partial [Treponema sp.]|nr:peptide chain release factor 2 [Treponema sp.]